MEFRGGNAIWKAKEKTYWALVERGLPVPPDLRNEIANWWLRPLNHVHGQLRLFDPDETF